MGKNKPFKVLSASAMTAALALSALTPVASAAPAEQELTMASVVVAQDGKLVELSLLDYAMAYADGVQPDLEYVKVGNEYYTALDYAMAYADADENDAEALKALVKDATPAVISPVEGSYEDGKIVFDKETTPEVPAGDFTVESVKAINAALVSVTFSEKVDPASAKEAKNYVFTKNNKKYGEGYGDNKTNNIEDAIKATYLLQDGKTVVFELNDADNKAGNLDNGDKYSIDVKNAVKNAKGEKVAAYGDTQKEFKDETAPVVTNATLKDTKDAVRVYFNEAVSFLDTDFGLTIDGYAVKEASKIEPKLAFIELKDDKGEETGYVAAPVYYADIPLEKVVKKDDETVDVKELTSVGEHEVTIYNLRDIVSRNGNGGNKVQLTGTTYEVTKQADAAELVVTSVTPIDFNSLAVNFNRTPQKATIKVLKGETVFFEQTVTPNSNTHKVDLPYTVLSAKDGLTTLYGKDATTADVRVIVENYEDENAVLGETYDKSLTLQREAQTPVVKGEKHNTLVESLTGGIPTPNTNPKLVLPLETYATQNGGVKVKDAAKVKVYDKNGVQRTIALDKVEVKNGELTVELVRADGSKEKFEDLAPFKVIVEAGALEVETDKIDVPSEKELAADGQTWTNWVEGDFTNKLQNKKFETKVSQTENPEKEDTNFKHIEGVKEVKVVDPATQTKNGVNKNVITVEYKDSMTASAAQLKNYKLDGKALPAGTEISMDTTSKVVTITLPEGSVSKEKVVRLQITKDVITANNEIIVGNINTKEAFMTDANLALKDSVAPVLVSAQYGVTKADAPTTNVIEVTFSEALDLNDLADFESNFEVKANGTKAVKVTDVAKASDEEKDANKLVLTLAEPVNTSQKTDITIVADEDGKIHIKDANGNQLTKGTKIVLKAGDKVVSDVAKEMADKAQKIAEADKAVTDAKAEKAEADKAVTDAKAEKAEADKAVTDAKAEKAEADKAVTDAEADKVAADSGSDAAEQAKAAQAVTDAKAEQAKAAQAVTDAEAKQTTADKAVTDAEAKQTAAAQAVTDAEDKLADLKK